MRISDIDEMIFAIGTTRIMGRPVSARVPVEEVIFLQLRFALRTNQIRVCGLTIRVDELVGNKAMAFGCNVLDISALKSSGCGLHQTSVSFFASDPVVDV